MIYLLIASFFYANVVYRIPVGSYSYILASDILSWLVIITFIVLRGAGKIEGRRFDRVDWYLLILNFLMFALLFRVYFSAGRVFSEFGRAAVDTLRFTQFVICSFAVRSILCSSSKSIRYLVWTFIVATAVCVYGLIVDIGLQIPRVYADVTRDIIRPHEFSAFFTNNHASASAYLVTALSIGFGFILMKWNPLLKAVVFSCMTIIILAIIFSKSRSGIIGLSVSTGMFFLYYLRYRGRSIVALFGLIVMTSVFCITAFYSITNKGVMDRVGIGSVQDITRYEYRSNSMRSNDRKIAIMSVKSRFDNWQQTIEVIQNMSFNIVFGYGVNQQTYRVNYGGAHNNFLQVIVDLGIVGLGVFLLLLYGIGRLLRKPLSTEDSYVPHYAMQLGMRCGFWGLVATAFTQETFYMRPALGNFFGFYLALLAIVASIVKTTESLAAEAERKNHAERTRIQYFADPTPRGNY